MRAMQHEYPAPERGLCLPAFVGQQEDEDEAQAQVNAPLHECVEDTEEGRVDVEEAKKRCRDETYFLVEGTGRPESAPIVTHNSYSSAYLTQPRSL